MQSNHNKNAGRDLVARFARAVVTARLGRHDMVCPGSRRTLAIGTTYPRRSRADDDDRFPWQAGPELGRRHAEGISPPPRRRVVKVAARTGRPGTRQGVWSDLPVQPRPPPPHPPGAGAGPALAAHTQRRSITWGPLPVVLGSFGGSPPPRTPPRSRPSVLLGLRSRFVSGAWPRSARLYRRRSWPRR
jgi:hypothetical protein